MVKVMKNKRMGVMRMNKTSFRIPILLITASTFPRWENDTEPRFILDLAKALLKYFDVTVLAPAAPNAKEKEKIEGVKVIRYHYFPIHSLESLCYPGAIVPRIKERKSRILLVPFLFGALFFKLLKIQKKYDIIHANWLIPQGIIQSFFKTPFVITGHGGDVSSLNNILIKRLKIKALHRASGITVVSKELKSQLNTYYPEEHVQVVSMGCDTGKFGPQHRIDNFYGTSEKKTILFVGRLAEKKGVRYLIEAVKDIDARVIIVGAGPLEKQLKKQAISQGSKIHFLGAKNHDELVSIYASADIFVAPSIVAKDGDKEGLPTTIIEAMASGLPVIGSDSGGIREIIINNENGFLVHEKRTTEIAEKLQILLNDNELYLYMKENALKTAEKYSYSHIGAKYADILLNAIYKKDNCNTEG